MVNPLKVIFEGMVSNGLDSIDKAVMKGFFDDNHIPVDRDSINGLYDLLKKYSLF